MDFELPKNQLEYINQAIQLGLKDELILDLYIYIYCMC